MQHRFKDLDRLKLIVEKVVEPHVDTIRGCKIDDLEINIDSQGNIKPFKMLGKNYEDVVAICRLKIPFHFNNETDENEIGKIKTEFFMHEIYDIDIYLVRLADVIKKIRDDTINDLFEE